MPKLSERSLKELIEIGAPAEVIRETGGSEDDVKTADENIRTILEKQLEEQEKENEKIKKPEMSKEEFTDKIAEGIKNYISKHNLDKVSRAHGMFGTKEDPNGEKIEKLEFASEKEKAYHKEIVDKDEKAKYAKDLRVKHFFRGIMTQNNEVARALSEGVGEDGGFLVPAEFSAEIIKLTTQFGVLASEARTVQMSRVERDIPKKTGSTTAYWVPEEGVIPVSQLALGMQKLIAKKLAALVPSTNELLADTAVDIVQEIKEDIAEQIAGAEDEQLFNGIGEPFVGILQHPDVVLVTMPSGSDAFSDLTWDNLIDMEAAVVTSALEGSKYYMHRVVLAIIKKLKDTAGTPVWQPPAGSAPGNIIGYNYVTAEKAEATTAVSTAFLTLGNLRRAVVLGRRQDIQVEFSKDATIGTTKLFQQDMSALKFTKREAMKIVLPEALVNLVTAAS